MDDRERTGTRRFLPLRRIAGIENTYVCETLPGLFYFPQVFPYFQDVKAILPPAASVQ